MHEALASLRKQRLHLPPKLPLREKLREMQNHLESASTE
jgi:hypothetical protein